jgi:hypothetical protein
MIIFAEILLIATNIAMAYWHSQHLTNIKHGWWGAAYLAIIGVSSLLLHSWVLMIASLFIRKFVFDLSLNLFRNLPLFYVSTRPKSIIDRMHNYIFGYRSEIYMSIYFMVIIVLNIFLLK